MTDVARLAEALAGVRHSERTGPSEWRYHGRMVAREIDATHLAIRADFGYRDLIVRQFPDSFSVPSRFSKHEIVVADLSCGDRAAIEDALEAAWRLQKARDRKPAPTDRT
jgi:hypothetical protein